MSKIRRTVLVASTAIGLAGIAQPAFAAPAAETAAAAEEAPVGEIIVTANKRSESISKVGASVAAFDTTLLDKRNIVRLDELAKAVPNLALAPSTHGTPVFTLRGIGFNSDLARRLSGGQPLARSGTDALPGAGRPLAL